MVIDDQRSDHVIDLDRNSNIFLAVITGSINYVINKSM